MNISCLALFDVTLVRLYPRELQKLTVKGNYLSAKQAFVSFPAPTIEDLSRVSEGDMMGHDRMWDK